MEQQQQQSSNNNNTNNNNQQNHRNNNNNNNNRRRHHNNNNRNNNNNGAAASSGPSGGTPLQPRDNNATKENNNIAVPASKSQQQQNQNQNQNQNQSKANQQRRNNNRGQQQQHRKPKNTECFDPDHSAPDMRVVLDLGREKLTTKLCTRDVLLCPNLFTQPGDEHLHDKLLKELEECTVPKDQLMKLWHNDSHLIANDRTGFVKQCPIFQSVVDRIAKFFNMKINATRFNHYRDTTDWKPLHFDAAQFNPSLAKIQNITVGVSFGCTRDADFERADDSKNVVTFPLTNGSTYVFCQELNCMWRHGIRQLPPEKQTKDSRISIIAWGWVDQSTWEKL